MAIGGKAKSLQKLQNVGFEIPKFFICDESWSEKEVLQKIEQELSGITHFAVRSSAHGEDSKKKSFAGHFYSAIAVPKEHVYKEIQKVVSSYEGISGSVIMQEFIPSTRAGVAF